MNHWYGLAYKRGGNYNSKQKMADCHDHVNKLLLSLFCLLLLITVIDCYRYGSAARTLHIPKQKFSDQFGEKTIIIEADLGNLQGKNENGYERFRRSTAKHTLAANYSTVVGIVFFFIKVVILTLFH